MNEIGRRLLEPRDARRIKLLGSHFLALVEPNDYRAKHTPMPPAGYWFACDGAPNGESRTLDDIDYICALHHVPGHWCFAYLDTLLGVFHYRDSLGSLGSPELAQRGLREYVALESTRQGSSRSSCTLIYAPSEVVTPTQPDEVSCGCCMLMQLEALISGAALETRPNYTLTEIRKWRARWFCALLPHTDAQRERTAAYGRATAAWTTTVTPTTCASGVHIFP